jgi:putative membrane protein
MFPGIGIGLAVLRAGLMLFFLALLVLLAVLLVKLIFRESKSSHLKNQPLTAREILDQRYVRGEITREQYELIRKDIMERAELPRGDESR